MTPSPPYTVRDVARICRVLPGTVQKWIRLGRLAATKSGRAYRVTHEQLRTFAVEHGMEIPESAVDRTN